MVPGPVCPPCSVWPGCWPVAERGLPQVPKGQCNPPPSTHEGQGSSDQTLPPCRYKISLLAVTVGPLSADPPQGKAHETCGRPGKEQEEKELVELSPRLLLSDHGFHMLPRLWSAQNCDPLEPKWPTRVTLTSYSCLMSLPHECDYDTLFLKKMCISLSYSKLRSH